MTAVLKSAYKLVDFYGIPITAYVRIRKLQYSIKDLLADMKVIDVAMKYSFESHEGFSRSFKSLFGSSPKDIKKHLQKYDIPEFELFANCKTKSMEEEKISLSDDMHKMIFTILGNSFEEMTAGFCSKIELSLLPDNCLKIFDDGRGIKRDDDGVIHEEVLQNLFSGKPITKLEYAQMGDLPFDDFKLVNSLCEKLIITVWRNGKIYEQITSAEFLNILLQAKLMIPKSRMEHRLFLSRIARFLGRVSFVRKRLTSGLAKIIQG